MTPLGPMRRLLVLALSCVLWASLADPNRSAGEMHSFTEQLGTR